MPTLAMAPAATTCTLHCVPWRSLLQCYSGVVCHVQRKGLPSVIPNCCRVQLRPFHCTPDSLTSRILGPSSVGDGDSSCDLSEVPKEAFAHEAYTVVDMLPDDATAEALLSNPLHFGQLAAIAGLPGKPLSPWGEEVEDFVEDGDLCLDWARIGFVVGAGNQQHMVQFDLWLCAEPHHWHAVFVFRAGCTKVLLRDAPPGFCEDVQRPERARELSGLAEDIMWNLHA